ncbi:MAG: ribose 5-phosphate isomerase B [Bacteroidales bacterium]
MFDIKTVIAIGSDHAGFELKEYLIDHLSKEGYLFKDYGTYDKESVDYPDYAHALAKDISNGNMSIGILICGTGNGISMTANKHPHVRCALCWNKEIAELSRMHNNANILALPGRFIDFKLASEVVKLFLKTPFEGGRHQRRIEKMDI